MLIEIISRKIEMTGKQFIFSCEVIVGIVFNFLEDEILLKSLVMNSFNGALFFSCFAAPCFLRFPEFLICQKASGMHQLPCVHLINPSQ